MNQITETSLTFDEAIMRCTNLLQSKNNPEQSLEILLSILGQFYQGDSAYILELNEKKNVFEANYQWNTKESAAFSSSLTRFPLSTLDDFSKDLFSDSKLSVLTYDGALPSSQHHALKSIDTMLLCPLVEKGKKVALIAITNVNFEKLDLSLLECASSTIHECLQKREMYLQLASLHNLDPLTGFFNKAQYEKKVFQYEEIMPQNLGIMFVQMIGMVENGEIYGEKYVDVKIKNASILLNEMLDYSFYRIDEEKFICFITNLDQNTFETTIDRVRLELTSDSNHCVTVGNCWCTGDYNLREAVACGFDDLEKGISQLAENAFCSTKESLEKDLLQGIADDLFVVHLQPTIELSTEKTKGADVLARRYIEESQTLVPLDSFIPLYEENELIRLLDLHIFKKTCGILSKWEKLDFYPPITIRFNRRTLAESGMVSHLSDICNEFSVSSGHIIIEVVQSSHELNKKLSDSVVDELVEHGFMVIFAENNTDYTNYLTFTKVKKKKKHLLIELSEESTEHDAKLKKIIDKCDEVEINNATFSMKSECREEINDFISLYGDVLYASRPLPVDEFYENYKDIL